MTNQEIEKKLILTLKDVRSAKHHLLQSLNESSVEAAISHLENASQDLVSLFAILPEEFHPSHTDLHEMGFWKEELLRLYKPPHDVDEAYMQIVDHVFKDLKKRPQSEQTTEPKQN